MTNTHLALGWMRQARYILDEARKDFQSGRWHLVVRRCQESVELALKSLLGSAGIEIPKLHDVGFLIKQNEMRFSDEIKKMADRLQSISRSLANERETSFYGDEELMLPPDQLYNEGDAQKSLEDALFVLELVSRLVKE